LSARCLDLRGAVKVWLCDGPEVGFVIMLSFVAASEDLVTDANSNANFQDRLVVIIVIVVIIIKGKSKPSF
jgi:hypothetical protein